MNKRNIFFVAGSLLAVASFVSIAFAETFSTETPALAPTTQSLMTVRIERNGRGQLEGTLAAISGTTLTVASWGGNWTVDASQAKLVRRYGGNSDISEFQVGDALQIQGAASQGAWSITATIVKNNSIQVRNVDVSGVISDINTSNQSFTLTPKNGQTWQVTLKSAGKVYVNGQESSFSALTNGINVRVRGVLDRTMKTVMAERIDYRQQKVAVTGTISNLNTGASSFSLSAEKGTLQVMLQSNAVIRINNGSATFADLQNGMTARIQGLVDQNLMTLSATRVDARFAATPQTSKETGTTTKTGE